jgi:hypothetical protein
MAKGKLAGVWRSLEGIDLGHQRDITVVAHPKRRLVCSHETGDRGVLILIRVAALAILTGLRCPTCHAERRSNKGHGAAISYRPATGTDIQVDPIHRICDGVERQGGE